MLYKSATRLWPRCIKARRDPLPVGATLVFALGGHKGRPYTDIVENNKCSDNCRKRELPMVRRIRPEAALRRDPGGPLIIGEEDDIVVRRVKSAG